MGLALLRREALSQVPRILGFGDRDPQSPTYGCFDRSYWHYLLHDVANARFQEAALLLARLYRGSEAPYAGHPKIAGWANAAVAFWLKTRNRDGSANEVYPFERGFCATAFSTWAVTEAILVLGDEADVTRAALRNTGAWLLGHDNLEVANQQAAGALAFLNLGIVLDEPSWREAAVRKLTALDGVASPEGIVLEYDGPDPGYLSITLGLMARFHRRHPVDRIEQMARRNLAWLDARVAEDGTFDGALGSRRMQYLYPYGLWYWKSALCERLLRGIEAGRVITPGFLDDRYCVQLTTDYLETAYAHDTMEARVASAVPAHARA